MRFGGWADLDGESLVCVLEVGRGRARALDEVRHNTIGVAGTCKFSPKRPASGAVGLR